MKMSMSCSPTIRLEIRRHCGVCNRDVEDEQPHPIEWHILHFTTRGKNIYQPCLECHHEVPNPDDSQYCKRARAFAKYLREEKTKADRRLMEYQADREWPAGTKSLVGELWTGSCPACGGLMQVNHDDYYECLHCRLQLCICGEVSIIEQKGLGQFKFEYGQFMMPPDDLCGTIGLDNRIK